MSLKSKPVFKKDFIKNIQSKKFGLVSSEWNSEIVNRLLDGVFKFFDDIGINKESILQYKVPGSFELIYGCAKMKKNNDLDAIIAIGSLIKGETKHFDFISDAGMYCDNGKVVIVNNGYNPYMGAIIAANIPSQVVQRVILNNESPKSAVEWGHAEIEKIVKEMGPA